MTIISIYPENYHIDLSQGLPNRAILRTTISICPENYHIELSWELPYRSILRTTISIYPENYHIDLSWELPYRSILRTTISICPEDCHVRSLRLLTQRSGVQPWSSHGSQLGFFVCRSFDFCCCCRWLLLLLFWHPKLSLGNLAKQIEFISLISK